MKTTTIFCTLGLCLFLLVLGLSSATIFSINRSAAWDRRIQLAQESYALHLRLEAHIYQLFIKHDQTDPFDSPTELRRLIANDIRAIRAIIAQEIALDGVAEQSELAVLDEVEAEIAKITAALAGLSIKLAPHAKTEYISRLDDLLRSDIDQRLSALIAHSLAGEQAEVAEVMARMSADRMRSQTIIIILMTLSLFLIAGALFFFNRQVRKPFLALRTALEAFKRQDFSKPVSIGIGPELIEIEGVLNDMAATQRRQLAQLAAMPQQIEDTTGPSATLTRIYGAGTRSGPVQDAKPVNTDRIRLDLRRSDLRDTVRAACDLAPEGVVFDAPAQPAPVTFDAVYLRRAILGILRNAHADGARQIRVSLSDGAKHKTVHIHIQGPLGKTELGLGPATQILLAHGGRASRTDLAAGASEVTLVLPKRCQMELVEGATHQAHSPPLT